MTDEVLLTRDAATDVTASLTLVIGTNYTLQARGGDVLLTEQAAAPDITTVATHLAKADSDDPWIHTAESGINLYAWARYNRASLSVTKAA